MIKENIKLQSSNDEKTGILMFKIFMTLLSVILVLLILDEVRFFGKYSSIIGHTSYISKILAIKTLVYFFIIILIAFVLYNANAYYKKLDLFTDKFKFDKSMLISYTFWVKFLTFIVAAALIYVCVPYWFYAAGIVPSEPIKVYDQDKLKHAAIHEAGHCIVGEYYYPGSVKQVKIFNTAEFNEIYSYYFLKQSELSLGVTAFDTSKFSQKAYKNEIINTIKVSLAGVASDDLISNGNFMAGANGDIKDIDQYIQNFVSNGFSKYGQVDWESLSPEKKDEITLNITNTYYKEVKEILADNRDKITKLSDQILSRKDMSLSGDEIRNIIKY